jgi:hypothetical protein
MHVALGVMAGIGARKPKIVRRRFAKQIGICMQLKE